MRLFLLSGKFGSPGQLLFAPTPTYHDPNPPITLEGVTAYVLTAAAGSYAVGGQAAGLLYGHRLTAAAGSYSVSGQAAGLLHGYRLTCAAGAYVFTGNTATLTYTPLNAYVLTAEAGSYSLSGQAADLQYSAAPPVVVVGSGGDRGINLLRGEPEPRRKPIPRPASFAVTFFQAGQQFYATHEVESELELAGWTFESPEFDLEIEALSELSFQSEQEQITAVDLSAMPMQGRSIPIRPYFEAMRSQAEFVGGDNEMEIEFEVEA